LLHKQSLAFRTNECENGLHMPSFYLPGPASRASPGDNYR
jgi:hypothetical protein